MVDGKAFMLQADQIIVFTYHTDHFHGSSFRSWSTRSEWSVRYMLPQQQQQRLICRRPIVLQSAPNLEGILCTATLGEKAMVRHLRTYVRAFWEYDP